MAPRYVEPAVRELRESTRDERVRLLLGVAEDRSKLVGRLQGMSGLEEIETVGRATVRVTAPKSAVDRPLGVDGVKSADLDSADVHSFNGDSGN